jgi:hypothetical protein
MLWIEASSAENIDGVSVNTSGAASDWNLGLAVGKLDTGIDQGGKVSAARVMIEHD